MVRGSEKVGEAEQAQHIDFDGAYMLVTVPVPYRGFRVDRDESLSKLTCPLSAPSTRVHVTCL